MPRFSVKFFFCDKDAIEHIITADDKDLALAEGRKRLRCRMGKPWRIRVREIK